MFTIIKAVGEDFDRVYPLFQGFGGAPIPEETWKKIFVTPWESTEDFCGYLLLKDDQVAGYLGAIFSRRILNGNPEKFCNMTSWVVSEECRGQSIFMLLELLKLKGYTLTNFTASPTVATILGKLGFKEFRVDQRVLLPVPRLGRLPRGLECEFDLETIRSKLTGENLKIFDDHQGLNCQHLLLSADNADCYVITRNTERKRLPFTRVHYLSNVEVFHECMENLIAGICRRLKVFGVMVDERYIAGRSFRSSLRYPHQRLAFFKSSSIEDENRIDTLYSESVILHN